ASTPRRAPPRGDRRTGPTARYCRSMNGSPSTSSGRIGDRNCTLVIVPSRLRKTSTRSAGPPVNSTPRSIFVLTAEAVELVLPGVLRKMTDCHDAVEGFARITSGLRKLRTSAPRLHQTLAGGDV